VIVGRDAYTGEYLDRAPYSGPDPAYMERERTADNIAYSYEERHGEGADEAVVEFSVEVGVAEHPEGEESDDRI
jgi:hypothetical protein